LAAEVLERQGYRSCIVGDLASVVYGSDVVIGDIHIAVADDAVQSARETLLEHGYSEEAQTNLGLGSLGPAEDSTSGWPGVRLQRPSAKEHRLGILLIPASLWHLDLNGPSYLSDTMLFPRSMCRFPRLEVYLNALINTVVQRSTESNLSSWLTNYIRYQLATIIAFMPSERRSQLPAESQFYIQFYYKILLPKSWIKFLSLWRGIGDGSLSVSDAIAKLPKRDMRLAELKAKHAEVARKAADAAGVKKPDTVY